MSGSRTCGHGPPEEGNSVLLKPWGIQHRDVSCLRAHFTILDDDDSGSLVLGLTVFVVVLVLVVVVHFAGILLSRVTFPSPV